VSGVDLGTRLDVIAQAFACSADVAQAIDSAAYYGRHEPQATIVWAGDDARSAFLVIAGHAQSIVYSAAGAMVLLDSYEAGDLFGEASVLGGIAIGDEVVAVDTVETAKFANQIFIQLMEQHGAVALAVLRRIAGRLSETTRRMVEMSTLSATGRIYAELLRLARTGGGLADGRTIAPPPVFSALALRVQSTRETVSRTINDLERRGLVSRDAERLILVAPHRIEEMII